MSNTSSDQSRVTPAEAKPGNSPELGAATGSAPSMEEAIARASSPQAGDTFRRGKRTIKVARIDNRFVHLAHHHEGVFIRETSCKIGEWPQHARATITFGAEFSAPNIRDQECPATCSAKHDKR